MFRKKGIHSLRGGNFSVAGVRAEKLVTARAEKLVTARGDFFNPRAKWELPSDAQELLRANRAPDGSGTLGVPTYFFAHSIE